MASLPGEPGQVPTRRRGSRLTSVSAGPVVPRPPAETPSRQQFGAGRPWPARRRGGDSETSAARAARGALPPGSGPAPPGAARRPRRPTPRAEGPLTAVALGLAGGGGRSAPQRPASLRGPASGRRPDTCADSGLRARSPPRPPSPGGVPAAPATPGPSPAPSSRGSTAPVAMARIRGGRTRKRAAGGTHARTHARRTGPGGAAARAAPPPAGSRAAPAAAPPADPEVPLRRRRRLVRKPGAPRRPPRVRARGPQGAVPRARPGRAAGRAWRPGPVVRSGAGPGGPSPRPVPRPGVLAASLHGAGRPRSPTQSGGTRRAGGPRSRPASCYSNMWLRRAPSGQSSVLSSLRRSVPASLQAECGGHGAALPAR